MLNTLISVLVIISAISFWLLIGIAIFRIWKSGRGTNEKIRTHEQVVGVIRCDKQVKTID